MENTPFSPKYKWKEWFGLRITYDTTKIYCDIDDRLSIWWNNLPNWKLVLFCSSFSFSSDESAFVSFFLFFETIFMRLPQTTDKCIYRIYIYFYFTLPIEKYHNSGWKYMATCSIAFFCAQQKEKEKKNNKRMEDTIFPLLWFVTFCHIDLNFSHFLNHLVSFRFNK